MESLRLTGLGWFDHSNCGDEAFKLALSILFQDPYIGFVNSIPANQEVINSSDHLIIGGGNIVDVGFLKGLGLVRVPYSFVGVGVVKSTDLTLLSDAENVIVRDKESFDLVSAVREDVILAPDLAFSFTPSPHQPKGKRPLVGVFLNDCVSPRFDSTILKFIECEKVKLELSRFLESLPYEVIFIPMSVSPPDDRRISLDVIGKMKNGYKYRCITQELQPMECLNIVSSLDFAITMRLHASIFCTLAGVPFIDITHHDKSKGYLSSIGMPELGVDFYELSIRNLQEKFTMIETNRKSISQRLLSIADQNKRDLEGLIRNVHLSRRRKDKGH